jgi:hypothetical protein
MQWERFTMKSATPRREFLRQGFTALPLLAVCRVEPQTTRGFPMKGGSPRLTEEVGGPGSVVDLHPIVTRTSPGRRRAGLPNGCGYSRIIANNRWLVIPRSVLIRSRCCRCQAPLLLRGDEHCPAQDLAALARMITCDRCSRSQADARSGLRSQPSVTRRVAHRGVYLD